MIFWTRSDGKGMMRISDELYKQACDLGIGIPSVAWSDAEVDEFIEDPEAFAKSMRNVGVAQMVEQG